MLKHWREALKFLRCDASFRKIVFYSEGPASWIHLGPIAHSLLHDFGQSLSYLTSSEADPGLQLEHENFMAFCVGAGTALTMLFKSIDTDVFIMTTPDLENFHLKRSLHPAHYIYVHHSMVSMHMIYRPEAFDHFDTIFCTGPHHIVETRRHERLKNKPQKNIVAHGYGRLDQILQNQGKYLTEFGIDDSTRNDRLHILIAPTWGSSGLIENAGILLVQSLLNAGLKVTLRPHPETLKHTPRSIEEISAITSQDPSFHLELDVSSMNSFYSADLMISDWSGVALEYAFGTMKPVIFFDTPRKVLNPNYQKLGLEPLEVSLREHIGLVAPIEDVGSSPEFVTNLMDSLDTKRKGIAEARDEYVFNLGASGKVGAERILEIVDNRVAKATNTARYLRKSQEAELSHLNGIIDDLRNIAIESSTNSNVKLGNFSHKLILRLAERPEPKHPYLERMGILRLSRKVDIAGKIYCEYDEDWNKAIDSTEIDNIAYLLFAAILIREAWDYYNSTFKDKDYPMMLINSALICLDIVVAGPFAEKIGKLAWLAQSLSDEIIEGQKRC
jgi:hypothetical protein